MSNGSNSKWAPFNALVNSQVMVNDVISEKSKTKMPVLSDDQIQLLEETVRLSLAQKVMVNIKFFKAGRICIKKGIISKIDSISKKLELSDGFSLYFGQIIDIF